VAVARRGDRVGSKPQRLHERANLLERQRRAGKPWPAVRRKAASEPTLV
jgi:hypothetical protein